jgi:hypothetical protein
MRIKITALALTVFTTGLVNAQQDAINRFFSNYEANENVTVINVSGSLFRMMSDAASSENKATEDDFIKAAQNIQSVHIIVDSEDQNAKTTLRNAAVKLGSAYESMMSVRDKDVQIEMYISESAGVVSEFVMALGSDKNFILMSVLGKFNLEELGKISGNVANTMAGDVFGGIKVGKSDFKVWPNPIAQGENCKISIPNDMLGSTLTITDTNGRKVLDERVNEIEKSLNLSKLSSGVYVVKVVKDDVEVSKKLIVQ